MRYTTVIDISEMPELYRNPNIVRVYIHLCLKAGYHDDDRDRIQISIRSLSMDLHLSIATVRHALSQLIKAKLLVKEGTVCTVSKYVYDRPITKRAKTVAMEQARQAEERQQAERRQAEERYNQQRAEDRALRQQGKDSYMLYYEMQMAKAEAGDLSAQQFCRDNLKHYNDHKISIERQANGKSKSN